MCRKAFLLEDLGLDVEYLQTTRKSGADTAGQPSMGRLTRGGRAKIIHLPGAKWAVYFRVVRLGAMSHLRWSYASSGEEHVPDVGDFWFEFASTTAEMSSFMLTLLRCSAFPYWRAAAMVSLPSISADDSDFVEGRNMKLNLFAQARSGGYPNVHPH